MIKKIDFISYKKLNNIFIEFSPGINIISGANGTCKSSILHVISNSYKKTIRNSALLSNNKCINDIKNTNKHLTPKIETLNRLSQSKIDASNGARGNIYTVTFSDDERLEFRSHIARKKTSSPTRYRVIPHYSGQTGDRLREALLIYLSMDRLYPYGEYQNIDDLKRNKSSLPAKYNDMIIEQFKKFTSYEINEINKEVVGNIKYRSHFSTKLDGIDSNTISSGEDNLMILLTALYSLVYYSDSLKTEHKDSPCYLLIDEFDASLHPEFQLKFLSLFNRIHQTYNNMHLVVTTHSLSSIKHALKSKYNVIYLQNSASGIKQIYDVDMRKIESDLSAKLFSDLFGDTRIPIISEDNEARVFLKKLFDYISSIDSNFNQLYRHFVFVEANMGSDVIKKLFQTIDRKYLSAIGVLDGDQNPSNLINNTLVVLPGETSPELVIYSACQSLISAGEYNEKSLTYICDQTGLTYNMLKNEILPEFERIVNANLKKGERREELKKLYNKYVSGLHLLFNYWIKDPANKNDVDNFIKSFQNAFYQVVEYHGLQTIVWPKFTGQNK